VFNAKLTFRELAREYVDLSKPTRVSQKLIEIRLIGGVLRERPVRELADAELQRFINGYVEKGSSPSLLSKLTMYLRAILDTAFDRRLIERNPARKLRAKSRKRLCHLSRRNARRCYPRSRAVITWRSASWCSSGFDPRKNFPCVGTTCGKRS
jgi:hypothetical protein